MYVGAMSVAPKLRILPGLGAFLLPWLLQAAWAGLLVVWLGGLDGLSRTLGMAGPSVHRIIGLSMASTVVLAIVLFFLGAGRNVPLGVPVVFATVPWWLGVAGALRGMGTVLQAVASVPPEERSMVLMQGTGEVLCLRMFGAWSGTALLLATAGALLIAGLSYRRAGEESVEPPVKERMNEGVVVAMLALVAWLAAFESLSLAEFFFATSDMDPLRREQFLASMAGQLRTLGMLGLGARVALVLAFLALGRRHLARRPRKAVALGSMALVLLLAVGTLWADAQPLARLRDAREQVDAR
jgi:hypothetical protein